jgi:hypothetical protein
LLPFEIIGGIIQHCRGDFKTLATLSLVCRRVLSFTRPLFFDSVAAQKARAASFVKLIRAPCSSFPKNIPYLQLQDDASWDTVETVILQLAKHNFTVENLDVAVCKPFKSKHSLYSSLSITKLTLQCLGWISAADLAGFICAFDQLQCLSLVYSSYTAPPSWEDEISFAIKLPPHLHRLTIRNRDARTTAMLRWILKQDPSLTSLKVFFSPNRDERRIIEEFMVDNGRSLTHLALLVESQSGSLTTKPSRRSCKLLNLPLATFT